MLAVVQDATLWYESHRTESLLLQINLRGVVRTIQEGNSGKEFLQILLEMNLDLQAGEGTVLATADVAIGWRRLTNTFGFCEESRMEMSEGDILRVQASIRAWPNYLGNKLREYPTGIFGLLNENWGRLELREQSLRITINLVTINQERLPRSGLPGVYQKPVELDRVGRVGFWLSLLVLRMEITQRDYPEIMEWDTQFFTGGRPGSSRRH